MDNLLFLFPVPFVMGNGSPDARFQTLVPADHHIFQNGHMVEETDILEGSGQTLFIDHIGFHSVDPGILTLGGDL